MNKRVYPKPAKKRIEFSKILAIWAAAVATITVAASFILAAHDKQPVSDLATVIFTSCIGYLITYAGKSAYEKGSRNKHGLDENGIPYQTGPDSSPNQNDQNEEVQS